MAPTCLLLPGGPASGWFCPAASSHRQGSLAREEAGARHPWLLGVGAEDVAPRPGCSGALGSTQQWLRPVLGQRGP